jgi:methanogenic corrinoid protein MtbC1
MTTPDITEMMEPYLQHAIAGDGRAGVATAIELLDRGVPSDSVIVDLLGGSQREVGERWLVNKLTVADEHFASGITQKALDAVSNAIDVPSTEGNVIVACAEGDWHSLPAQMFAELLHSRGFTVAFLGASTPVDHVAGMLRRRRPDALAVSCNLPLFFGGLTRLADAAHAEGIPVIAGGRALGDGPDRAIHLGADAWAAGIADAEPILRSWQHKAPAVAALSTMSDSAALFLGLSAASEIAARAFEDLSAVYPAMASYSARQLDRTREDLQFITQFVAAARLVDDPNVLTDFLRWLQVLLSSRGVPVAAIRQGLAVLAPHIARIDDQSGQLAFAALETIH